MADGSKISIDEFTESAKALCGKISPMEFAVDEGVIRTFCETTGHDFEDCKKNNVIPQGYFMTLTIPLITRFFIEAALDELKGVIKGVIHTNSVVQYYRPLPLNGKYTGHMGVKSVVEKTGSLGNYYAVDFEVVITDGKSEELASDIHQFFLRV